MIEMNEYVRAMFKIIYYRLSFYCSNGETMTHKGLNVAHTQLNNNVHSSKLAIVLTDGRSNDPDLTKQAANSLHRLKISLSFSCVFSSSKSVNSEQLNNGANQYTFVYSILL